ncbi:MAG: PAS domain S-box protein, partial [Smithellaceae bacterium]
SLTFSSYRKERKWSDDLVRRIKLIGEIIANTIQRINSQRAIFGEVERRKIMEERYESILKTANIGFWISDPNQNILVVNDEYCRMSGYTPEELKKMKISDIDISKDPQKIKKDGAESILRGSHKHESKHLRKDGKLIDVEIHSNFLEREGVYFSFTRDITELNKTRRELEERLHFERLISEFSAALINVKLKDIKKEVETWIECFAKLLHVDRFTLSEYKNGFKLTDLLFSYTNPDVQSEATPLHSNPVETYGFYKYLKRGEEIKFESPDETFPDDIRNGIIEIINSGTKAFILMPLKVGDILLGTMSISTITHTKKWTKDLVRMIGLIAEIFANALMRDKADFELENYRKRLEKMVEERTIKLEEAQKELVISEKMATLGKLTATVSHELRNPLGTIRTSIYSLKKRLSDQNEKVINALNRAERNIIRCDLIIEDLLNYSRTQELNLKPTAIDNWINDVLGEMNPPHGVIVEKKLKSGATINMDQERFRRCILNILTNAYQAIQEKNDDENGCVCVRTYRGDNTIILVISDNGVGFDMANVKKIYEPLYSTKTFGIGLGVTITKQIIEQHGWRMEITGAPREGASVQITIPNPASRSRQSTVGSRQRAD